MALTYTIGENLFEFSDEFVRMIEVKIISDNDKFENQSANYLVRITDGSNEAFSFLCYLSVNQMNLLSYFPIDALSSFGNTVTIQISFIESDLILAEFTSVSISTIPTLPVILNNIPFTIGDSAWVASLP